MNEISETVVKKKRGRPKKNVVLEQLEKEEVFSLKEKIIKEISQINENYKIDETRFNLIISHSKLGFVQIRTLLKQKFNKELIVDIAKSRNLGNQKQLVVPKR